MTTRTVLVDMRKALALAARLCLVLHGQQVTVGEVALLMAYCELARGVRDFPAATRQQRVQLVVERAGFALCDAIERVGAMTDEEVLARRMVAPVGPERRN